MTAASGRSVSGPGFVDTPDRGWVFRRICFYGILVLQMFAVLAFGAVDYWAIAVLQCGALLLFTVWVVSVFVSGSVRLRRNPLFLPMLAFIGWVGLQFLTRSSAYVPSTRDGLMLLISDFLIFFVLVNTVETPRQKLPFVMALVAFGAAVALFGLVQDFSGTTKIYWMWEQLYGGAIYGPYINHNHFAGFLNMLALFPLSLLLGKSIRRDKAFLALALTALMFAAVVLSGSRSGIVDFIGELLLLGLIFMARRQARQAGVVAVVILLLGALSLTTGISLLRDRYMEIPAYFAHGRLVVWRESLRGIKEHWALGSGFGTFWVEYPRYRLVPSHLRWNETHNDYLQLLFETGVPGFLIMLWFLWRLVSRVLPRLLSRDDPEFGMILGATLGIFGLLMHSLTDFNLQLPANAMLFLSLCALVTA